MAKRSQQFQTICTEGAILPPDILRRIASLKVDGANPDAYHLSPGSKLNEAISQSWTSLLNHWRVFKEAGANLPESDETGTAVTNERWLLPLFKELDFGRLVTTKSPEIDERVYAIERFYNHTPIHLIGCKLPLDRRTQRARGAATASPHSMVQEFLNRSDEHLWAFLSNGLQLRILRDNISLSRQAFVEFDLEAMMEGEVYADFALLWLLCHQSRVESDKAVDCWLEKWSKLARDQGTRVLNELRVGVHKAVEALGRGFIGHPRNDYLREKLSSGTLATDEFYRQLLRIVYRLLFLFVAEDRELLHPPDASTKTCDLFDTHYSTRRLRELAHKIRGSKHADLWHSLSLVFDALSKNGGCPQLGLSGLGSFLWRPKNTADLLGPHQGNGEAVFITNDDLLQAVRALAYVEQDKVLRIVDYRNLGSEELGSVYESLLELHPLMNAEAKAFELSTAAGNERKTTGSYYTPDSLVQCLLDSALDPVVEERLKKKKSQEAEQAILDIKVCDPACGSGHFLIAAAHRLARHLARVRTGETEPSPDDYQHALRDIIGRCVYGVDINPMAVELCKVSLWMEAIEPGKPLSFLDHHIQCGNSLLGTTPALLAKGIPDDAFKAIEGDVKQRVNALKKDNKRERQDYESGQGYLFSPTLKLGNLPATISRINVASDESLEDVTVKQEMYEKLVKGADYLNARLLADTWCATFVWKKDESDLGRLCPTEHGFRSIENNPHSVNPNVKTEVQRLGREYRFFHWHLAFPDVFRLPDNDSQAENEQTGWDGGFDVLLGNPPWEKVSPDSHEFFEKHEPRIRSLSPNEQDQEIERLLGEPEVARHWSEYCRQLYAMVHFLKCSGRYVLFAAGNLGKGDFDVYRIFVELSLRHTSPGGYAAMIAPGGLYGGANCSEIRKHMLDSCTLRVLLGLSNTKRGWFEHVDIDRFAAFSAQHGGRTESFDVRFDLNSEKDMERPALRVTADLVRELSPETYAIPSMRRQSELDAIAKMYAACPQFGKHVDETPYRQYLTELHMTSDRDLFKPDPPGLPVYEGRMVNHFDHRAKNYVSGHGNRAVWEQHLFGDEAKRIAPQWYIRVSDAPSKLRGRVDRFRVGFCHVANPRNARSFMSTLIPPDVVCGNGVPTFVFAERDEWAYLPWLAVANSLVMDSLARRKLSSPNMTHAVLDSLPFPRCTENEPFVRAITPVVLSLCCTSPEMTPFWNKMADRGLVEHAEDGVIPPQALINESYRRHARAVVDAVVAGHVFGLDREQLEEALDTFPQLKRRETKEVGEYKTKLDVLLEFDRLADGDFLPMAEWDPKNCRSHIHPPRNESEVAS